MHALPAEEERHKRDHFVTELPPSPSSVEMTQPRVSAPLRLSLLPVVQWQLTLPHHALREPEAILSGTTTRSQNASWWRSWSFNAKRNDP